MRGIDCTKEKQSAEWKTQFVKGNRVDNEKNSERRVVEQCKRKSQARETREARDTEQCERQSGTLGKKLGTGGDSEGEEEGGETRRGEIKEERGNE